MKLWGCLHLRPRQPAACGSGVGEFLSFGFLWIWSCQVDVLNRIIFLSGTYRTVILVSRGGEMGWSHGGTENGTGQLEGGTWAWEMTCFSSQLWELWGAWSQVEHPRHKLQQHRWVWGIRGGRRWGGRAALWAERTKPGPPVRGRGGQWGFPLHCWGQWLGLWWMRLPFGAFLVNLRCSPV